MKDRDRKEQRVSSEILDRQPPFDLDAEKAVIGSMMLATDFGEQIIGELLPDDFYDDANRHIFAAILSLLEQSRPVDSEILIDRLKARGAFERCGGMAYLVKVFQSVPNASHIRYYAQIVSKHSLRRRIIDASTAVLRYAWEDQDSGYPSEAEIAATAEDLMSDALQLRTVDAHKAAELFPVVGERIRQRLLGERGTHNAITTGLKAVDNLVGGAFPGEVIVLAARPSMGKTALSTQIAANLSFASTPVVYVSLEMSADELAMRQICSWAGINLHKVKTNKASAADGWIVEQIAGDLATCKLTIVDQTDITAREIVSVAKQIKRATAGPICVMVDYLGLVTFDGSGKRHEQIGKFMKQMKRLARQTESPVILMSQLNRAAETEKEKRPKLSNLRESGDIEQDADQVWLLHRQEYYEPKNPDVRGQAEIIVAKNRNGPVGVAELLWNKTTLSFKDRTPDAESEVDSDVQQAWDKEQEEFPF